MADERPEPKTAAGRASRDRKVLPTSMGSAEIRDTIAADVRGRAVFVSRCTNAIYLSKVQEVIDAIADGEMDHATARVTLLETLRALGYTPEGGFPDDAPGTVPEALAGTLQDLSSKRRLDLIINTQRELMRGVGQQVRGHDPHRLNAAPCWELYRAEDREAKRRWGGRHHGAPPKYQGQVDPRSRWEICGGVAYQGRLIAPKGDPIWGELGSSGNFEDALDVDYPPFAFNSGMRWREVTAADARALGVKATDGRTLDAFLKSEDRPRVIHGELPLPAPVISMKGIPPAFAKKVEELTGGQLIDGKIVTKDGGEELRKRMAERRAARAERRKRRLDKALEGGRPQ